MPGLESNAWSRCRQACRTFPPTSSRARGFSIEPRDLHFRALDINADPSACARIRSHFGRDDELNALESELAQLRQERDAVNRAFFEAAQVQRRLSGPRQLRRGSFEIAGELFPVSYLSGDFLSTFDAHGRTFLAIGDLAGKSLSAGMWFTYIVGLIRIYSESLKQPAAVASAINRHCAALRPEPLFGTLFLGSLDQHTGELEYCNAGHPAPLLLRRSGMVEALADGGPLLGALPDAEFACGGAVLRPGDTLLGYTDGILECRNAAQEEFGMERLTRTAVALRASSANAVLFSVLAAAQDFAGDNLRNDDFALLVARRRTGDLEAE
jgi:serine phosphatase RsbU (regulator of sigma subunit)